MTTVAVIGLGYVGLPLVVAFGKQMRTIGFDIAESKVESCQRGVDPSRELADEELEELHVVDRGVEHRALELEAWFGKHAGRAIRQWMYGELVRKRGAATKVFLERYPASLRGLSWLLAPLFELGLRKQYRLDEAGIARARATVDEVFDRLEQETASDPSRYLVGDALSIADIAAASLIGPLVAPLGSPWASLRTEPEVPAPIQALRAALSTRPGWAWVEARYRDDRRPRA